MRRVVVTGLGLVTPLGGDVETTWAKTRAHASIRVSALRERYDTPDAYRFETEEA